ncbi:hypothetical protein RI367_002507 [Sorochytrium milnesiophthora]
MGSSRGSRRGHKRSHDDATATSSDTPQRRQPELPGFYWDEQRNRYFRILPKHSRAHVEAPQPTATPAPPQEATADAPPRSLPLPRLLRQYTLDGGQHHRVSSLWAWTWTSRSWVHQVAEDGLASHETVDQIAVDPEGNSLWTSSERDVTQYTLGEGSDLLCVNYNLRLWSDSASSSLYTFDFDGSRLLGRTTTGSSQNPGSLTLYHNVTNPSSYWSMKVPFNNASVWSSTLCRASSHIVVGGTKFLQDIDVDLLRRLTKCKVKSDVFALTHLPQQTSVVASGHRDGSLRIFDLRRPSANAAVQMMPPSNRDAPVSVSSLCVTLSGAIYALDMDGCLRAVEPGYPARTLIPSPPTTSGSNTLPLHKLGLCPADSTTTASGGLSPRAVLACRQDGAVNVWDGERVVAVIRPGAPSSQMVQLVPAGQSYIGVTLEGRLRAISRTQLS